VGELLAEPEFISIPYDCENCESRLDYDASLYFSFISVAKRVPLTNISTSEV